MDHRFNITQDQRYFRIFGARRCGNHALIDFIAQNIGSETILLNNCSIVGQPFFSCRSFEHKDQIYTRDDTHGGAAIKLDSATFMAELSQAYDGVNAVFAFFEEQLLPDMNRNIERLNLGIFANHAQDIVTTREFSNWLASSIKQHENYNPDLDPTVLSAELVSHYSRLIHHWLIHAKAAASQALTPHVVHYEDFATSAEERRTFLSRIGVPPVRLEMPRKVSGFGGGSSFSGFEAQPNPEGKTTPERKHGLPTDSSYHRMRALALLMDDVAGFVDL